MRIPRECFFGPDFPKNGFWGWNIQNPTPDLESALPRYRVCANFQAKRKALIFSAQICLKTDLGLEIQKPNFGTRISILEIPCVPIFQQKGQL